MFETKSIHILYMEDDLGLARLLQKNLERNGYTVDLAPDGATGLAMYETGAYDVVAVDHNMPMYDGLEVIRRLAERGPLPPTIMITGAGNEKIAIEAMKLGAGDYIVKDVEGGYLELLPSVIEQVLYQQRLVEEKQKAVAELQQLNRNLALLSLVGQELAATLDLQEIMDLLLQAVTDTIGAEGSSVWLQDEEPEAGVVCRSAYHYAGHRLPVNLRLRPGQGIAGWVVEEGESVVVAFAREDPRFSPEVDREIGFQTRSMLAVPLRIRRTVIGVLEVINKKVGAFNSTDRAVVETLAASAAVAIDNARMVEKLRQQTIELQARNEELDAFAHTVAHDLKTPLGPIIGLSQLLENYYSRLSKQEIQEALHGIARSGSKMNNIINELLLLAQMHEADMELEPLDMADIVAEASHRLSYMIEEYQAELILPSTWPVALGYGPWIEEVWANYLSNAMKYGGQPPRIVLGATPELNGSIRFWIHDNGTGLTTAEQSRLFAPFTQLDKIRAEGHGLGLSIVRRIVEKLGGQVGVESEGIPGRGSVFFFTLPAAISQPVEQLQPEVALAV
jgi:signal transduction histidine kinase/DNA-binding response OmpR family regulator